MSDLDIHQDGMSEIVTVFATHLGAVDMATLPGDTLIERMARALCLMNGDDPDSTMLDDIEKTGKARRWMVYAESAQAALCAARGWPITEEFIDDALATLPPNPPGYGGAMFEDEWKAVIDAVLREHQ